MSLPIHHNNSINIIKVMQDVIIDAYSTSTLSIRISSNGLSILSVLAFSIRVQISIPFMTRPKTVCLLSSQGVGTVVIKTTDDVSNSHDQFPDMDHLKYLHWDPFVFGPAFAIETVKGRSCLSLQKGGRSMVRVFHSLTCII